MKTFSDAFRVETTILNNDEVQVKAYANDNKIYCGIIYHASHRPHLTWDNVKNKMLRPPSHIDVWVRNNILAPKAWKEHPFQSEGDAFCECIDSLEKAIIAAGGMYNAAVINNQGTLRDFIRFIAPNGIRFVYENQRTTY